MAIDPSTTPIEMAALVSQALESAGITATLSGGAAVGIHSANQYQSHDLDFVTAERRDRIAAALAPLGFLLSDDKRHFLHPRSAFYLEFPSAPIAFGGRTFDHGDMPRLATPWGPVRIITPTACVMDRLSAWWHWHDRQSWDQAVLVVRQCDVDFADLVKFAREERADPGDIARLRTQAGK